MNSYQECVPFEKRRFSLDGAKLLIISLPIFGSHYEATIPLKEVREDKDVLYLKNDIRMAVYGVPGFVLLLSVIVFSEHILKVSDILFYALIGLSIVSMVVGLILAKKNKFYRYYYVGGNVAFDIGENGNQRTELEGFSQLIDKMIAQENRQNKS